MAAVIKMQCLHPALVAYACRREDVNCINDGAIGTTILQPLHAAHPQPAVSILDKCRHGNVGFSNRSQRTHAEKRQGVVGYPQTTSLQTTPHVSLAIGQRKTGQRAAFHHPIGCQTQMKNIAPRSTWRQIAHRDIGHYLTRGQTDARNASFAVSDVEMAFTVVQTRTDDIRQSRSEQGRELSLVPMLNHSTMVEYPHATVSRRTDTSDHVAQQSVGLHQWMELAPRTIVPCDTTLQSSYPQRVARLVKSQGTDIASLQAHHALVVVTRTVACQMKKSLFGANPQQAVTVLLNISDVGIQQSFAHTNQPHLPIIGVGTQGKTHRQHRHQPHEAATCPGQDLRYCHITTQFF